MLANQGQTPDWVALGGSLHRRWSQDVQGAAAHPGWHPVLGLFLPAPCSQQPLPGSGRGGVRPPCRSPEALRWAGPPTWAGSAGGAQHPRPLTSAAPGVRWSTQTALVPLPGAGGGKPGSGYGKPGTALAGSPLPQGSSREEPEAPQTGRGLRRGASQGGAPCPPQAQGGRTVTLWGTRATC